MSYLVPSTVASWRFLWDGVLFIIQTGFYFEKEVYDTFSREPSEIHEADSAASDQMLSDHQMAQ